MFKKQKKKQKQIKNSHRSYFVLSFFVETPNAIYSYVVNEANKFIFMK